MAGQPSLGLPSAHDWQHLSLGFAAHSEVERYIGAARAISQP